jgi:geranylgeranyl transferase type-2 subunit beta
MPISRREVLVGATAAVAGCHCCRLLGADERTPEQVVRGVRDFILRCSREDGGFSASPDPKYTGNSDTASSDLAAVTYAAVLAKTMGWELPRPKQSIAFVRNHQQPSGRFINLAGTMDPKPPLPVLYNTTQGVVALRALGAKPDVDPTLVMTPYFEGAAFKKLPWYTTSFFPLFFAAIERPFPEEFAKALSEHIVANQAEDGYLQDHVAATFHAVHFFRLIGKPTPKARQMVARVVRDQKPDGGWNIKAPDWDVHACFDALFILRQLGGDAPAVRDAIARGGCWARSCRNDDGGFGHFPGRHSDMDAVYFNFGSLIQAGIAPGAKADLPDGRTLGWGHAMVVERTL